MLKLGQSNFYHSIMCPKDADRMANSVDPDQSAASEAEEQYGLGLYCLPRPVCLKTLDVIP